MKKIISALITICITLLLFVSTSNADDTIKILVNNKEVFSDQPPVIVDGRTLVPVRAICEAMECEVVWLAGEDIVEIKNPNIIVTMEINNPYITVTKRNNVEQPSVVETDVPPKLMAGDRVFVPARVVAESFGAKVGWDEGTNTVMIIYATTLNYTGDKTVATFAGNGERNNHDSNILANMSFVSPESIDAADDGTVYVADSGRIRAIKDGVSSTTEMDPSYLTAGIVRCYQNDVYILTNEFENDNGVKYYGIVKLTDGVAEGVFSTEAVYSKISDFTISNSSGDIYMLQYNAGVDKNYIGRLNLNTQKIDILTEVDSGIKSITCDNKGNLYLANTVKGSIYKCNLSEGKVRLFAGVDNKTKFVDGNNPFFFEPRKIKYYDNALYVLDYNVMRKITINSSDQMINCLSLAGKITVDSNPDTVNGKASELTLAPSYLMDFVLNKDGIILTDPKKAVLREIR